MGDSDEYGLNDVGGMSTVQAPMSFNIIGSDEGLLVDPSLQPFITLQGNKTISLPLPVEVPVSSHIVHNNNVKTAPILSQHNLETPLAPESFMIQDSRSNCDEAPKKLCPLEMSIKAADLDLEFEKDPYVITNNGITFTSGCVEPMSLSPYTTVFNPTTYVNAGVAETMYTQAMMSQAQPLTLTLQPSHLGSGQQVLLLQMQPSLQNPEVPSQPVIVPTSQLLLPAEPVSYPITVPPSIVSPSLTPSDNATSNIAALSIAAPSTNPADSSVTIAPQGSPLILNPVDISTTGLSPTMPPATIPPSCDSSDLYSTSIVSPSVPPPPIVPSYQRTEITRDESEASADNECSPNLESLICEVDESGDSSSFISDDEVEPEEPVEVKSLVLKIRKVRSKSRKNNVQSTESNWKTELLEGKKRWKREKESKRVKKKRSRNRIEYSSEEVGWSASDDETLAKVVKQRREDEEYKNNKECFRRAPKCCPRCCHVKIQPKYQEIAFREFLDLERRGMGDCYLGNCIALEPNKGASNTDVDNRQCPTPAPSDGCSSDVDELVSMEIANESNGNLSVSEEIENAIRESLKDQETADNISEIDKNKEELERKKNLAVGGAPWAFYLVINNRLKAACLNLLLAVLRIPQSRVEAIQNKITAGEPLDRMPVISRFKKAPGIWPMVKKHLETIAKTDVPYCLAKPPHKRFLEPCTRKELFECFRKYYLTGTGNALTTRFETYRRLIAANTNIAFPNKDETTCAACEFIEGQTRYHGNSGIKGKASKKNNDGEVFPAQKNLKSRKRISESLDSEVGDKQPAKVKKRRKTGEPVMNGEKKLKQVNGAKKEKVANRKPAKRGPRGDVFSLMLLHLKTLQYKTVAGCVADEGHKFFDPKQYSAQTLYEDYRKFFLKETNSELGLRYQLYESLLLRNRCFSIAEVDSNSAECPRCSGDPPVVSLELMKSPKKKSSSDNR